ncbi:MAG: hypothetical protein N2379_10520 [Verrucomicrobiae bacterium]|nr:hypothetical protein [Verrucomicrobiae bacterium]
MAPPKGSPKKGAKIAAILLVASICSGCLLVGPGTKSAQSREPRHRAQSERLFYCSATEAQHAVTYAASALGFYAKTLPGPVMTFNSYSTIDYGFTAYPAQSAVVGFYPEHGATRVKAYTFLDGAESA